MMGLQARTRFDATQTGDHTKYAMALKVELQTWDAGVKAFEREDWSAALENFQSIADSSKIHYNIGMTFQRLRQYNDAIMAFGESIECDNYLSIAYFQRGVCYYIMGDFTNALEDFNDSLIYLRGNSCIDYTQLGLEYRLYGAEALYNRALCHFQVGAEDEAFADLDEGLKVKELPEHDQIERAIHYRFQDCRPFHVPEHLIYKPSATKLENAEKKDYLGAPKVVAAIGEADHFAGFSGSQTRRQAEKDDDDKPTVKYNTNLRRQTPVSGTQSFSRPRQGSAPTISTLSQQQQSLGRRPTEPSNPPMSPLAHVPPGPPPVLNTRTAAMGQIPSYARQGSFSEQTPWAQSASTTPGASTYNYASYGPNRSNATSPQSGTTDISKTSGPPSMVKVKCHFEGDTRALMMSKEARFDDLQMRLAEKYKVQLPSDGYLPFHIEYKDEDGSHVRIEDDEDWLTAIEYGEVARIELWLKQRLP